MEPELLRAFRRGDRQALESVYRLYARHVEGRARHVLLRMGRLSAADLGDIVQDVFVHAFSDDVRARYDGLRDYLPFLLAITRNMVVDWARRSGRQIRDETLLEHFTTDSTDARSGPFEGLPFDLPLVAIAERYVESLPPALRAVHRLRFELAQPQRQVAKALGISRQSLRTLEKKLIGGLRSQLRCADIELDGGKTLNATRFLRQQLPAIR